MSNSKKLSEEDMARVNSVIHKGYNNTEREPFKPFKLLFILWIVVSVLGGIAIGYAKHYGLI